MSFSLVGLRLKSDKQLFKYVLSKRLRKSWLANCVYKIFSPDSFCVSPSCCNLGSFSPPLCKSQGSLRLCFKQKASVMSKISFIFSRRNVSRNISGGIVWKTGSVFSKLKYCRQQVCNSSLFSFSECFLLISFSAY